MFPHIFKRVEAVDIGDVEKEIIIVESNSTDGTRSLVDNYFKQGRCKLILQDRPRGKGNAVREGLKLASGDIILIQDADLEYNPEEYPELIKPIVEGKTKFVLGSRHLGAGSWKIRSFDDSKWYAQLINYGTEVFGFIFALLYGQTLTDPQTMFKVFRRECMYGITWKSNYFQLDWEIVCKFVKRGYIPMEIPVSYDSRSNEEGKKIKLWRDGPLALWAMFYYRFFG